MAARVTLEEFERAYAARSGFSSKELHELGGHGEPCDCDGDGCPGWQMVFDTLRRGGPRQNAEGKLMAAAKKYLLTGVLKGVPCRFDEAEMRYIPTGEAEEELYDAESMDQIARVEEVDGRLHVLSRSVWPSAE